MARLLPALATPAGMLAMSAGEAVRAGRNIAVRVEAWSELACAAGVAEAQRHVRATSVLGIFAVGVHDPEPVLLDAGANGWVGGVNGETWRPAGSEYTVAELARAITGAAPGVRVDVFAVPDAGGAAREILEASDPRSGGPVTRLETGAAQVTDTASALLEGTAGAARGVADLTAGVGQGAQGIGGVLRAYPLLALAVVVAVVVMVRRGAL